MRGVPIDQEVVRPAVEGLGLDWHYRESTESTNSDALEYFRQHRRGLVAFAEAQRAGRGRRGRQWVSPHAQNIYCTVGLVKSMPAAQQGLLSIVTGLALCRALISSCGVNPRLKWPNDLLVDGAKLGGILIETRPQLRDEFFFAIGFGLNVYLGESEREAIEQSVTSLHLLADEAPDRSGILAAAIGEVADSIRAFNVEAVGRLADEFSRFDAFHDQSVELIAGDSRIAGINRGIDHSGALRLETARGIEAHAGAEISLVPR